MNMLRPLGNEVLRFPRDFQHLPRAAIDLPRHKERNELLRDLPEVDVPAHEKVFVAPVGIAERIRIVLENVDFSRTDLLPAIALQLPARQASSSRSPALSWMTKSRMLSHSGVEYSGWQPVS